MSEQKRDFDKAKYMSCLIKDDELLETFNEIWEKVCNSIKKGFDSEPVCNEKYLKTKIKSFFFLKKKKTLCETNQHELSQ